MSVRYEWMHLPTPEFIANNCEVSTGDPVAVEDGYAYEDVVTDGGAVVLSDNECCVITGTPEELVAWAESIIAVVKEGVGACSYCGVLLVNEDCPNYGDGPEHEERHSHLPQS